MPHKSNQFLTFSSSPEKIYYFNIFHYKVWFSYNNYKKKNLHIFFSIFLNKFHPRLLLEINRKSRQISRPAIWTHCILTVKTDKIRREPFENDNDFSTIAIERN